MSISNFDNFYNDQISSKLAQRQYFAYNFNDKKILTLISPDDARNTKFFKNQLIPNI